MLRSIFRVLTKRYQPVKYHAASQRMASTLQFDWTDGLNLESQLTDEEILLRDQVKSYCTQKLMPRILEANRHEKPDDNVLLEMGDLGILGPTIKGECAFDNKICK